MRDERWQQMTRLFQEAVELPPEEMDPFLRRSCGEDADLDRAVRQLLEADREAGEFMQQSPYRKSKVGDRVIQFLRNSRVSERRNENNETSGQRPRDLPKEKREC